MGEKGSLRGWLGFKGADDDAPSSVERIRELESQLADLQSRRDITSLTQEEFEILATETAMTMIKSAQSREAKAKSLSDRILNESARQAKATVEDANLKAQAAQAAAESRGQKLIQDAQAQAASLVSGSKLEAAQIVETAERDSERIIGEATREAAEYRQWLSGVISDTERHHKVQLQSLATAESAILQSRAQLEAAFGQFVDLKKNVDGKLNPDSSVAKLTLVQSPVETENQTPGNSTEPTISVLSSENAKRTVKRTADSPK